MRLNDINYTIKRSYGSEYLSPSSMPYLESNVTLDFTVTLQDDGIQSYGKDNITLYAIPHYHNYPVDSSTYVS